MTDEANHEIRNEQHVQIFHLCKSKMVTSVRQTWNSLLKDLVMLAWELEELQVSMLDDQISKIERDNQW